MRTQARDPKAHPQQKNYDHSNPENAQHSHPPEKGLPPHESACARGEGRYLRPMEGYLCRQETNWACKWESEAPKIGAKYRDRSYQVRGEPRTGRSAFSKLLSNGGFGCSPR